MPTRGMAMAALVCLTACSVGADDSGGSFTTTVGPTATATATATVTTTTTDSGSDTDTTDGTSGPSTSGTSATTDPTATTGGSTTDPTATTGAGTGGGDCGNNIAEAGENCDGVDLKGQDCTDFGWTDGTLVCGAECNINTDACFSCGDNTKDNMEACDGTDFGGDTCQSLGFGSGTLSCSQDCQAVDTGGCQALPTCGDNMLNGSEQCEGANLGGDTCMTLGWDMGSLSCNADCTFNTSQCQNDTQNCAGMGEVCVFDENDPQSNCCPPGVKGNVIGICDIFLCI